MAFYRCGSGGGTPAFNIVTLYNTTDSGTRKKYTFNQDYDLVLIIGGYQLGQSDAVSLGSANILINALTEIATRDGYTYAANYSRVILAQNVKAGSYYHSGYVRGMKVYEIQLN